MEAESDEAARRRAALQFLEISFSLSPHCLSRPFANHSRQHVVPLLVTLTEHGPHDIAAHQVISAKCAKLIVVSLLNPRDMEYL